MANRALLRIDASAAFSGGTPINLGAYASDTATPGTLPTERIPSPPSDEHMEPIGSRAPASSFAADSISADAGNVARPCRNGIEVPALEGELMESGHSPSSESHRTAEFTIGIDAVAGSSSAMPIQLSAAALQGRPGKMFVAGSGRVLESGAGAAVEKGSNLLVKLACEMFDKPLGILAVPALERKAILGYALDDEEALGYVLGDAVGYALDDKGARAVSKRAGKHLKEIKMKLSERASTARKAARKAGSCPDAAGEQARQAYLREPFDLKCDSNGQRSTRPPPPRPPKRPRSPPQPVRMTEIEATEQAFAAASSAKTECLRLFKIQADLERLLDKAEAQVEALGPAPSL